MGKMRKDALYLEFLPGKSNVKFVGPKRIGSFSSYYDTESQEVYCPDNSAQRYLASDTLDEPIDCLEGYNPETECLLPSSWSHFFRWIVSNKPIIDELTSNGREPLDFMCSNMELKKMMITFCDSHSWLIRAVKNSKTIFLFMGKKDVTRKETNETGLNAEIKKDGEETEKPKDAKETKAEHDQREGNKLNYARFNVIRKITKRVEEREANSSTEMDVLSTVSFSKIGKHRILHTGFTEFVMSKDEVDKPIDQVKLGALKLMPKLYNVDGSFTVSFYRHMYWWASALLCGVKTFICGDLEDDFTLRKLDVLPVSVLNKRTAPKQKKCLIALDKILDFIKSQVQDSDKLYEFRHDMEEDLITVTQKSFDRLEEGELPWYFVSDILN